MATFQYGPFAVEAIAEPNPGGPWGGYEVTVTNEYGDTFKGVWYTGNVVVAARMAIRDLARAFQYPELEPELVEGATMFGPNLLEAAQIVDEIREDYEKEHDLSGKKKQRGIRQGKSQKTTVGVDSGMLLIIDPSYLFNDEQWKVVGERAKAYGDDWPRAVLESLSFIAQGKTVSSDLAAVMNTCGDNVFNVRMKDGKIQIDTNCR